MDFLYSDGDDYYFMNTENYEQTNLKGGTLGDAIEYLIPNLQIKVSFFDGVPVGIELPQTVEMTVVETEPGLKSATASSVTKPAKLETGLVVQVPPFINEGEKIRVDTAEGAYLSSIEKGNPQSQGQMLMVRHYVVKGRVQGVGFRWLVHREAGARGLKGWVRNTEGARSRSWLPAARRNWPNFAPCWNAARAAAAWMRCMRATWTKLWPTASNRSRLKEPGKYACPIPRLTVSP
jgi:hypothetical protein